MTTGNGRYSTTDLDTSTGKITRLRIKLLDWDGPQYMLAAKAGIAPARISEYQLGKRKMPMKHVLKLCEVLHCDPREIIGEVTDEELAQLPRYDDGLVSDPFARFDQC